VAHQVLVLVGLLVTYGIAAVAALGAEKAIRPSGFYVALPAPAWILRSFWPHASAAPSACRLAALDVARHVVAHRKPVTRSGARHERGKPTLPETKYIHRALRGLGQSYPATRGLPKNTQTCESHGKP
jgi:hypothetical protein